MTITNDTLISRRNSVVAADAADEAILLDIDSGYFFQLNTSAAQIWHLTEEPVTFGALCLALQARFKVSELQCAEDLQAFVSDLAERGILDFDA